MLAEKNSLQSVSKMQKEAEIIDLGNRLETVDCAFGETHAAFPGDWLSESSTQR